MKIINSETEMLELGRALGQELRAPVVVELIGDVGAGKTTLTQGLAAGLGVVDAVTSPSFTISKRYAGERADLAHYDFYRLADPGIMSEDFFESIADPKTVTVVEWGESVADLLPEKHVRITISVDADGSRKVELEK